MRTQQPPNQKVLTRQTQMIEITVVFGLALLGIVCLLISNDSFDSRQKKNPVGYWADYWASQIQSQADFETQMSDSLLTHNEPKSRSQEESPKLDWWCHRNGLCFQTKTQCGISCFKQHTVWCTTVRVSIPQEGESRDCQEQRLYIKSRILREKPRSEGEYDRRTEKYQIRYDRDCQKQHYDSKGPLMVQSQVEAYCVSEDQICSGILGRLTPCEKTWTAEVPN